MTRRDPAAAALAQALALADEMAKGGEELQRLVHLLKPLVDELRLMTGVLPGLEGEPDDFEAGFSSFWAAYPVKVGKEGARRAARKASLRPTWPGWRRIVGAVEAQKQSPRWRGGTVPNPETWLNGGRWDDDPATMTAIGGNGRTHEEGPVGLPESIRRRWGTMSRAERALVLENQAMGAYR